MDVFLQLTVAGLSNGMIYALVASGIVVIYKSSDVINFAQGEFLLFGAYLTVACITQIGMHWSLGVFMALCLAVLLGIMVERVVLRPLIGEPVISMIMVTIGLSSVLRSVVLGVWGPQPRSLPPFIPSGDVHLGTTTIGMDRLVVIGSAALLLSGLALFFRYTRDGIALRAVADDQQAALSMGISISRVLAVAWGLAAVCAAFGGLMVANIVGVSQEIRLVGLTVFPVVILGGLDSIGGAVLGGAVVGLLEAYTSGYIGLGLNRVIPFGVLLLVLMVRPYGLFGKERIERV